MEDLGINQKIIVSIKTKPLEEVSGSYTYFADGDVLLAKITPCFENGKLGIAADLTNGVGFGSSEYLVFRPEKGLEKDWLYYFLSREAFRVEGAASMTGAVGHKRVAKEFIEAYPIPIPPLPEQRRIVGILDEAFAGLVVLRANAEKNLQNARALFESHLNNILTQRVNGGLEKRLSEIAIDFGRGKSKHRPRNDPKLYGGNYPFIQTGDVRNCSHLISAYSQTYNETGLAQSKLWPKGTLCITIAANIAETGILDFAACFPDSVIGVVVDTRLTSNKFLEYLLQSFKVRLQAQGKGSAQDNINLGTFESQTFPFPDVKTQNKLVSVFDALRQESECLATLYQQKLDALDALKKSILHHAFTGQL